jgi:membrane protease YdiL (CAAX protease family)
MVPIVACCSVASAQTGEEAAVGAVSVAVLVRIGVAVLLSAVVVAVLLRKRGFVFGAPDDGAKGIGQTNPILWFVGALFLYIGVTLAGSGLAGLIGTNPDDALSAGAVSAGGIYGVGVPVSIAVLVVLWRLFPGSRFRLRWRDLAFGVGAFLLAIPVLLLSADVAVLVRTLVVGSPPDPIAHPTLELILGAPGDWRVWVILAGAIVGAPVLEETVYRGLLQTSVVRATGSRWVAIVLVALLFSLSHRAGGVPWHALVPIFVLGAICGLVMERRGVGAAIVTHGSFNASQVILAFTLAGQ